jgi:UDP-N-acetylglucosamine 2-epimerase (non-hydrolysing)
MFSSIGGKMKVLTLCGTRHELIRLSIIIKKLDEILGKDHILVYTNQNYDPNLKDIFFKELSIKKPNYTFKNEAVGFGDFLSNAIVDFDLILRREWPDKILVLGDTNTGLLTILAQKYNIPIYHMEAGNRCFDKRVPEEINRRIIDNVSTYNLPYTENSKQNLLSEGFHKNFIYKTGNPIFEVLYKYRKFGIQDSTILKTLDLNSKYQESKQFVLVTCHRSENVDNADVFGEIIHSLNYKFIILKLKLSKK